MGFTGFAQVWWSQDSQHMYLNVVSLGNVCHQSQAPRSDSLMNACRFAKFGELEMKGGFHTFPFRMEENHVPINSESFSM